MYAVIWCGNLKERHSLEELGVVERMIVTCIFEKYDGAVWTPFMCLKTGTWPVLENTNEPSGDMKYRQFLA